MKTVISLAAVAIGFSLLMSSISSFMNEARHEIDQKQQATISQFN